MCAQDVNYNIPVKKMFNKKERELMKLNTLDFGEYKKWCVWLCKFGFGRRGCAQQRGSYSNDKRKRKLHSKKIRSQ